MINKKLMLLAYILLFLQTNGLCPCSDGNTQEEKEKLIARMTDRAHPCLTYRVPTYEYVKEVYLKRLDIDREKWVAYEKDFAKQLPWVDSEVLCQATLNEDLCCVQRLLNDGIDPNKQNSQGQLPLALSLESLASLKPGDNQALALKITNELIDAGALLKYAVHLGTKISIFQTKRYQHAKFLIMNGITFNDIDFLGLDARKFIEKIHSELQEEFRDNNKNLVEAVVIKNILNNNSNLLPPLADLVVEYYYVTLSDVINERIEIIKHRAQQAEARHAAYIAERVRIGANKSS